MLEQGVLTGGEKAIFGLHNAPYLPAGNVGVRKGPLFASADKLHIEIRQERPCGYAPLDNRCNGCRFTVLMGLQSVISRNVNPLESAVVTIGSFHSGSGHNIISDFTEMRGTMRSFTKETRQLMYEAVPRTIEGIASGYGAKAQVQILPQTPAVNNDSELTEQFIRSAAKVVPKENLVEADLIMAAEDFALYQEWIPGCYFLIGTEDPGKGIVEAWHHPGFLANESVLPLASRLLAQAAVDVLMNE